MSEIYTHIITTLWIIAFVILKLKGIDTIVDTIATAILVYYYTHRVRKR